MTYANARLSGGAYYNERDPFAAQWLRNLIRSGHIAPGEVDERSITEISPDDLRGFAQCHFFAGIGVWSHALRRAGWADELPVWTGSCPCQPFSAAGKQKRFDDDRHLWPTWFNLIRECRPAVVLGEQVASALDWLDLVSADLEGEGYAFGAADLCAAGFQGAHIRQRLYFVGLADAMLAGWAERWPVAGSRQAASSGAVGRLADALRRGAGHEPGEGLGAQTAPDGLDGRVSGQRLRAGLEGPASGLAHADGWDASAEREQRGGELGLEPPHGSALPDAVCDPGEVDARWAHVDWLLCRNPSGEPSWRPVEPRAFPLAHGVAGRMGKLRAYGNALDAETASQFVGAVIEALEPSRRAA